MSGKIIGSPLTRGTRRLQQKIEISAIIFLTIVLRGSENTYGNRKEHQTTVRNGRSAGRNGNLRISKPKRIPANAADASEERRSGS